ncbi:MAG: type II toxin-antitoxin system RelE/ParE family toxin [Planctomycetaceae bacterium]|nr:type II toxin-antitoxin system RelE/ParE family toxin [Planctomycetaceae bacterium]
MATVRRTPQAEADLEVILDDLEEKSPKAAERFAGAVDEKCSTLGNFPEMGRARDEIAPGLRSTVVGRYVLFYQLRGDVVEVPRILHGRRDIRRNMRDEPQ